MSVAGQSWGHSGDVARRTMRGGFFREEQRSGPPPYQLEGLGEGCHYPYFIPPPKKNLIGFARILWACLSNSKTESLRKS